MLTTSTIKAHTIRIRIDNSVLTLTVTKFKIEKGDKATDWTSAPEDIDSAITSAGTNAVTTSKSYTDSQIKLTKESIELGVSQTYETKSSVTSQVSTALTSAKSYADTKKSEAISTASSDATAKANNALNSAKSYADTKKSEAITSANNTLNSTIANYYTKTQTDSQIKIAKDAINLGVSQTYETKTNVTSKVNSAISTASSDATSKANNALTSAKSYADTKKSEAITSANNTLNSTIANYYTKAQTDSQIKVAKDAIDLSVKNTYETKTEVSNKINAIKVGGTNLLGGTATPKVRSVNKSTGYDVYDTYFTDGGKTTLKALGFKVNDELSVSFDWNISKNGSLDMVYGNFRAEFMGFNSSNTDGQYVGAIKTPVANFSSSNTSGRFEGTVKLTEAMLGAYCLRIRTDNSVLTLTISNAKWEKGNKVTSWCPSPKDITSDISNAQATAISESKKYADSQIKIAKDAINLGVSQTYETKTNVTSKVNSAISTASSDATTKANNALTSAKSYADTKKSEAITSANNTLNTTIANYYTKTQTDSQIKVAKDAITSSVSSTYETKTNVQNKIDAIKVGGTNLLGGTGTPKTRNVNLPTSYDVFDTYFTDGNKTTLRSLGFKVNDELTVSFDWKISKNGSLAMVYGNFRAELMGFNSNNTDGQYVGVIKHPVANFSSSNTSGRLETTIKLTEAMLGAYCLRIRTDNSVLTLTISNAKWEKGNKVTSWSPSPKDTDVSISNLTQRVSTAESKITDTAITNVVKQNFYTKSETDNQITSKGYQTASQVQQTVDALQLKFTQSGGYNRVRNGIFKDGISQWSKWGSPTVSTKDDTGHSYGKSLVLVTTGTNQGVQQNITDLCSGKNYTLSAYVYTWAANDCGIQVACGGSYYSAKVPSAGSWKRISVTFKATATSATVQIGRGSWGANGQHLFTAIQFEEGDLATTYSPNPNEMYDGIIKMDKDGIKVSTSNGGWTDFTSAGMNVYNKSSMLSLGTRNGGLTYHNNSGYLGFTSESVINSYNVSGVTLSTANDGSYITLGTSTTTDPFGGFSSTPALSVSKADLGDSNSFYKQGVNLHTSLNVNTKPINRVGRMCYGVNGVTRTYESTTGNLCLFGDNGIVMGYYEGNDLVTKFKLIEGDSKGTSYIDTYAHWRFNNWSLSDIANLSIKNNLKMETTATIQFNSTATYPSLIWEASNRLKLYGNDGIDFGYRNGSSNMPIFKLHEGADTAYRIESFSHWNFNNWNLENVGILKPQRLQLPSTYGSNWIGLGTGDGNDYTTYNVKFRTHNGLAFTDNSDSATVIVQGRQGRIMGKNAYYVNCSRSLKSDIRSVISESDVATFTIKEGETLDTNISAETVCDFLDAIDVKTYVTDFKQEGATQECFDIEKGNSLTLGYIADDVAEHPLFKYVGEKTNDGLYAINSNSLTTTLIVGYQQEKRKREQLEERLMELERLLKGDE